MLLLFLFIVLIFVRLRFEERVEKRLTAVDKVTTRNAIGTYAALEIRISFGSDTERYDAHVAEIECSAGHEFEAGDIRYNVLLLVGRK